ncbi:MAG: AraC family transcriptional regulator [Planctomycetes bacterium]|nr:AraC family transcriptional regulator [Planctomycetota bacterium]
MLHDASGRAWRQTCFLPAAGPELERAEIAIALLGRFASSGAFDLRQVPRTYVLHLVHAGEGVVEADGRPYSVTAGTAFLFVPGVTIHYFDRPGRPWRYSWLVFAGTRAGELLARVGGGDGFWARDDLPLAQLAGVLDEIEGAYRSESHSPFYAQASAWRVLDTLSATVSGDRVGHLATAIRRILDERYGAPLKIGALARQLGVDRSTLFRRFSELFGCPPKTYLDRVRLEHAAALLRAGAIGVGEVASRCGYASARRFAKAFKARYGVAPSRYG